MKKIIFIYLIATSAIFAQSNAIKKADLYYKTASFEKAAEAYSNLIANGNKSQLIIKKAADSYYYTSNFEQAASLYKTIVEKQKESFDNQSVFRYAQCLKAIGKIDESNTWMKRYKKETPDVVYKAAIEKLENIKKQGEKFEIKNEVINTPQSDFGPAFFNDKLIFSAPGKSKGLFSKKYNWNNQPYLDLYQTTIKDNKLDSITTVFSEELNSALHEANIAFTNDGKRIYFSRNNSENGKRKKDAKNVTHLGIYYADLVNDKWTNITPLPFNSTNYSVMHPTLNKENNRLYFSSDMPGTIGSFDIFYVDINGDSFGKPVNLGTEINTKNREQFPFISSENKLFFASDGHPGFGLLDVFMSEVENDTYTKPLNVGLPVNTNLDDFGFIYNDTTKKGYFASNRAEGKGDDDIYSFTQTDSLKGFEYYVEGTVIDDEENLPVAGSLVELFDEKGEKIGDAIVDEKGSFRFDLKPGTYKISVTNPNTIIPAEKTFTVLDNGTPKNEQIIKVKIIPKSFLEQLIAEEGEPKVITDNGILMFDLPEILFDYDKYDIRPDAKVHLDKLIDKLQRYPQIDIAIGAHTDNRGTEEYNIQLSQGRASSTMNYLVDRGIDPSRITAEGFGESQPKVNCLDHDCSDDEHQINRRSEFVIIVRKEE